MPQTLHLGFSTIPETTLPIDDHATAEDVIAAILAAPVVDRALKDLMVREMTPLYDRDTGLSQGSLDKAAAAFLKDGTDGLDAWGRELVDEDAHQRWILDQVEEDATYQDIVRVADCAVRAATSETLAIDDLLRDPISERLIAVLGEHDRSSAADLIGPADAVLICYAPAYTFGFEDDAILGSHKSLRPADVELNQTPEGKRLPPGYLAYLSLVNADPGALRQELDECGLAAVGEEAEHTGHAEAWRVAEWGYDPQKPSLHDAHTVRTVLENCGDCAVAMATMRVGLRGLIRHDFTQAARIRPKNRGKAHAGFINFVHGAGHDEPIHTDLIVPAGREKWHSAQTNMLDYEGTFMVIPSAFDVEMTSVKPEVQAQAA